jgi:hypothetical protein
VNAPAGGGATAQGIRDHFEERGALIEFDGSVPRPEAEQEALHQTAAYFGLTIPQTKQAILQAEDGR